jgi:hypothetical protein
MTKGQKIKITRDLNFPTDVKWNSQKLDHGVQIAVFDRVERNNYWVVKVRGHEFLINPLKEVVR